MGIGRETNGHWIQIQWALDSRPMPIGFGSHAQGSIQPLGGRILRLMPGDGSYLASGVRVGRERKAA